MSCIILEQIKFSYRGQLPLPWKTMLVNDGIPYSQMRKILLPPRKSLRYPSTTSSLWTEFYSLEYGDSYVVDFE